MRDPQRFADISVNAFPGGEEGNDIVLDDLLTGELAKGKLTFPSTTRVVVTFVLPAILALRWSVGDARGIAARRVRAVAGELT